MASLVIPKIECVEEGPGYGRFVAEPLEKGFGVTLGNSLRRVLLRYLPGAAVTHVWIEGIQHEFSPMPFIKEDTLQFLLNIKELRFKSYSGQPAKVTLLKQGEGGVYASDIENSTDFEVVNQDLLLATIDSQEGKIHAELSVEMGIGYKAGETKDDMPVGTIPVDAVFSPVRKANFTTEPMHAGRETSQERLYIEVWTDDSITPAAAVSLAAKILKEQMEPFVDFGKISMVEQEKRELKATIPSDIYDMPIEQLDLSVRALNCLKRSGVNTVGELASMNEDEVSSLRNFGQKSRKEVEEKLQDKDIILGSGSGLVIITATNQSSSDAQG